MNQKLKGGLCVFFGACSFGMLSTIVKTAYKEGFTLGQITGMQTMIGVIILWFLYLVTRKTKSVRKSENLSNTEVSINKPKTKWWKVSIAGCFTGLVGIFYYKCVQILPASIAIILLMQYLWISILIELIIFKKKPYPIQLVAVLIVLIGTVFAAGILSQEHETSVEGIVYGMLAACCYAIFLMTSGRVGTDMPFLKKSALMITGSLILTWIIFPPNFLWNGILVSTTLLKWGCLLALLGTVIPPLFFSIGVPKVGVSLGAILSAAELPVAVTASHFILHEKVEILQWFGVCLILGAIILTNLKLKNKSL